MPWASPKDDMASMEHPLFTLATRPDRRILRYEHGEATIEVTPSVKGLATIHDKDVLIYCVSQLMAALNEGRPTSPVLHLKAHDLLLATSRETSGDGYRRLREALERLSGTRIVTNIATGGVEIDARLRADRRLGDPAQDPGRADDPGHRDALGLDVPLGGVEVGADAAPGLFPACRKPLERRVYEIARKHCGRQAEWRIGLETLLKKIGLDLAAAGVPQDDPRHGRRRTGCRTTASAFADGRRPACVRARAAGWATGRRPGGPAARRPRSHARAREAAPGYDPYWLEAEWLRLWRGSGRPPLRSPEAAFLAFCRARAARAPRP